MGAAWQDLVFHSPCHSPAITIFPLVQLRSCGNPHISQESALQPCRASSRSSLRSKHPKGSSKKLRSHPANTARLNTACPAVPPHALLCQTGPSCNDVQHPPHQPCRAPLRAQATCRHHTGYPFSLLPPRCTRRLQPPLHARHISRLHVMPSLQNCSSIWPHARQRSFSKSRGSASNGVNIGQAASLSLRLHPISSSRGKRGPLPRHSVAPMMKIHCSSHQGISGGSNSKQLLSRRSAALLMNLQCSSHQSSSGSSSRCRVLKCHLFCLPKSALGRCQASRAEASWEEGGQEGPGPAALATQRLLEWPLLCEHVAHFASTTLGEAQQHPPKCATHLSAHNFMQPCLRAKGEMSEAVLR